MKRCKYLIILIIFIILFMFIYNNHEYIFNRFNIERIDTIFTTDTLYKDTFITIFKEKPIPKYIETVKTDTFYDKNGKDTLIKTENRLYQDTLCNKNDSIILRSYISGQNPTLDSLKVEWKKQEMTITNTVEIEKYIQKKKTFKDHFKIGVGVGYGYGFKNKDFEPFVGISLNYNF